MWPCDEYILIVAQEWRKHHPPGTPRLEVSTMATTAPDPGSTGGQDDGLLLTVEEAAQRLRLGRTLCCAETLRVA